jgi:glucoamylase
MRARYLLILLVLLAFPATAAAQTAPGRPGANATWTEADKDGYGTSTTTDSKIWHTLDDGRLTEVYYPDLGTPSVRTLEFIVSDGKTFAERDTQASRRTIEMLDSRSLTYRQVNEQPGRYRVTKTYATDPARNVLLIDVKFESLSGTPLDLYTYYDPGLGNDGNDDSGSSSGAALLASDSGSPVASALVASPAFDRTSSGYLGRSSDGWEDISANYRMNGTFASAPNGNVVQTGHTQLTGMSGSQSLTLALGFGGTTNAALGSANGSLGTGFADVRSAYQNGWHAYLDGLKAAPASANSTLYNASVMTLAAHEDKTFRGGYIASPTMPWVWGTGLENPSGAYHLVWSRDLYQIATALIAAGDTAGANRAVDYLFFKQQKDDGSFPQNSTVNGDPHWGNLQLDEVAFPIVLAWQLGRTERALYRNHIKKAADFILGFRGEQPAPWTPQERWENQSGYSPGTIASEIAGLVCAADIARRNGDPASAKRYEETADDWQTRVDGWTATTNGPYSSQPYYLRLTKDGNPNAGTTYNIGDSGPTVDQRKVVDPSYLELVRLGVKRADDPVIRNTVGVVDQQIGDASGRYFWHRFNFDGYGEKKDGSPWDIGFPPNPTEVWANNTTIGRNWPIFGGERGEYELLRGNSAGARAQLANVAAAANDGDMLPEQVWAPDFPPAGQPGFPLGEGTFSATPLAWSHAQYVRLAWSIEAGHPVERPSIVAARYGN